MKFFSILLFCMFIGQVSNAAVSKTVTCTAGNLCNLLSSSEKTTITNLTVTGTIDARDFKTMRDSMGMLATIDLSETVVSAYNGALGTSGNSAYSENMIPDWAFSRYEQGKPSLISIINPSSVTKIGQYAYYNCTNLVSINIPITVTYISNFAFGKCRNISALFIPSSVSTIQFYPFYDCGGDVTVDVNNPNYSSDDGVFFNKTKSTLIHCPTSKTGTYTIPSTVTTIGVYAFYNCTELDSIIIPTSVRTIKTESFEKCSKLNTIEIPTSVTSIEYGAFRDCTGLTALTIPASITAVSAMTFSGCNGLTSINFSSNLTSIGDYAFENCDRLKNISLPSKLKSIGRYAFIFCDSITTVSIPSSVTSIGEDAFNYCSGLIDVASANTVYSSINGVLFNKTQSTLIHFPNSISGDYIIPSTVTTLSSSAFSNCTKLTSIYIPSTVSSVGYWNFVGCNGQITVNVDNENFLSLDGVLYDKDIAKLWHCPISRKGNFTIPSTVTTIGAQAFYNCDSLSSIILPDILDLIDFGAFMNCTALTSISIPASVTFINGNVFDNCFRLQSIFPLASTPVGLGDAGIFNNVDRNTCTIYVPQGSLADYQTAEVWEDFIHIIEGEGFWLSKNTSNLSYLLNRSDTIEIHSNTDWEINCDQTWLTVIPETSKGDDTLIFIAEANPTLYAREATVTVSATGIEPQTINITQEASLKEVLSISATTFHIGEVNCLDALISISIAVDEHSVIFEEGSSTTLIAGQSIRFLPGFHAETGSYVDAHITTDGSFCDLAMASSSLVSNASNLKSLETLATEKPFKETLDEKLVKVYPNPNKGQFTVELTNFQNPVKITVVNMSGKTVYAPTTINTDRFGITMENQPKGLYLLLLNDGKQVISEKIIVE